MWPVITRQGTQFFGGGDTSNRREKFKLFGLQGDPDLPITKTLRRVPDLLTVMILKRVSESIFFQINKFTLCKFKDKKELANSLMAFNLLKIIHPVQGKKHLRT